MTRSRLANQRPLPQGDEKVMAVRAMFDAIAPRYDLLNRLITFRLDVRWRRRAVAELGLPARTTVVDLAAGTGDLCRELARRGYEPVGVDLSLGMLQHARTDAPLVQADAVRLPHPDGSVPGVVSGFGLRNFADLAGVLNELGRVVRPGGRISLLEVDTPTNPVLRAGHAVYFGHIVPRIGGLLSDRAAYRYLPQSLAYLPPRDELLQMVGDAGFGDVRHHALTGGIAQLITGTRR
jgi:demethylmenaquinone methyltransferase/2-methoxy-6-polyprenyl-1,4-benzoquinol methylase